MPSGKEIQSTQMRERRIHVALDAAGTILSGKQHASVVVNGTGDRTLTLVRPSAGRPLLAQVHALESDCTGYGGAGTVATIDVLITDLAATAADKSVLVEIIAYDSVDEI